MSTDMITANKRYEEWLRSQVTVIEKELRYKHSEMANRKSAFPFFRGTYYRWAEIWPMICPETQSAPRVLAVGDLHVENFGTWRDCESRLVWGMNDFDEAEDLPFTNDLIRLAASAIIGSAGGHFRLSLKATCRTILCGYLAQLRNGPEPFVLEENHPALRVLAMQADRKPAKFWKRLKEKLPTGGSPIPADVEGILRSHLPEQHLQCKTRKRPRTGMGSLGKPRYIAIAKFEGGLVAREAKALTPPSTTCLDGSNPKTSRIQDIVARSVRCEDPFFRLEDGWIVRRLAPHCSRIELNQLSGIAETLMFEAMGAETANIHSGTPTSIEPILRWIDSQKPDWLADATTAMIQGTGLDWKTWCRTQRAQQPSSR